jgi:hypothetical protein
VKRAKKITSNRDNRLVGDYPSGCVVLVAVAGIHVTINRGAEGEGLPAGERRILHSLIIARAVEWMEKYAERLLG